MSIEILLPALSPTMTHGAIAKWHKKEGDNIEAGELLLEVETDKAIMEVEATDDGVLGKILVDKGANQVPVNSVIGLLLEEGEDASTLVHTPQQEVHDKEITSGKTEKREIAIKNTTFASPLAKRLAIERGLDILKLEGTGPKGRVIKRDIPLPKKVDLQKPHQQHNKSELVPHTNMRKTIADRLLVSKQTIPHFYLTVECKVDQLLSLRSQMNCIAGNLKKTSLNDFVVKASSIALQKVPEVNASWQEDGVMLYSNSDISIAVAIEGGLITPIIRCAQAKTLQDISSETKDLIARARANKLNPDEYNGGTFCISNLGMYGIDEFSAIINPPHSAILAVGAVVKKPVVDNERVVVSNVMKVTLSCDHRVVDGSMGAKFLSCLRRMLENPLELVL